MDNYLDIFVAALITIILIIGGYQIYFLPQKYPIRKPRRLLMEIDSLIPFDPRWVWIYSFLYYPFIISVVLTIHNFRHFAYVCTSFIVLLAVQLMISFVFPVKTPEQWRNYDPANSLSERFLSVVHKFDKGGNCFPSMHVGVATLTSLHIVLNTAETLGNLRYLVFSLPALIAISTLFTKQHYMLDIPAGASLALFIFLIYQRFHLQLLLIH